MALINHVATGSGAPAIVFVHGFGCAHGDWDAQVAHFVPHHRCVAVDLRGHGETPGSVAEATVERFGADVTELMHALDLPPAVLVGHSMGCRVVVEAALQAPSRTAGVVLVDGSQFAAAMGPALKELFSTPAGFDTITGKWFPDMFTVKSDPAVVAAGLARAKRLSRPLGESLMCDMQRYDVTRLNASLASLRVPVMAIQTTYSNEKRERQSMRAGQSSPYLEMLRARVPGARIEIVPDTGHFPQIDEPAQTNALIADFLAKLK